MAYCIWSRSSIPASWTEKISPQKSNLSLVYLDSGALLKYRPCLYPEKRSLSSIRFELTVSRVEVALRHLGHVVGVKELALVALLAEPAKPVFAHDRLKDKNAFVFLDLK